ncbi:30S ribosomal protein THX [Spirosoma koreense]
MGKGDSRSRKGKISRGSYGNTRPHKPGKPATAPKPEDTPKS